VLAAGVGDAAGVEMGVGDGAVDTTGDAAATPGDDAASLPAGDGDAVAVHPPMRTSVAIAVTRPVARRDRRETRPIPNPIM
jgi:hypothetical protein